MRLAAAARTTASSLKAMRSSRLPPPRATISTSGCGSSGGRALNPAMAAAIFSAAPSPCTGTGQSRIGRGNRLAMVVLISCNTAPWAEVTTPTTRGSIGSGRRRSNSPSPCNFTRSASMRASSAPAPAYSSRSTMSWYSERSG